MTPPEPITLSVAGSNARATLAPWRGALVTSLVIEGRELLYLDEGTFLDSTKNVRGGVPVLFPTPGKLVDDRWCYEGRAGAMKQHGFARTREWAVASSTPQAATLTLRSDESTLAQFPWPFEAALTFELGPSSLSIRTSLVNVGTSPLPFGWGFHPYFAVGDKRRASIHSSATLVLDNVTQSTGPFSGFDLTADEVDRHLVDHPDDHLALAFDDGTSIVVRASRDYGRWVVWTLAGKAFVCVEPWTCPGNALNTGQDLLVLAPGATHESWVEIGLRLG